MLVMSGLVHKDFDHLLFNTLSYWFVAFQLQRVIGPLAFRLLHVGPPVLSEVPSWYKHRRDPSYGSLGASGALLGLLFVLVYEPAAKAAVFGSFRGG